MTALSLLIGLTTIAGSLALNGCRPQLADEGAAEKQAIEAAELAPLAPNRDPFLLSLLSIRDL